MFTTRSLLLIMLLLVPWLLLATKSVSLESPLLLFIGGGYVALTGGLIAWSTTQTQRFFIRKFSCASALAALLVLMAYVVFWTWDEDQRSITHSSGSPIGVDWLTMPFRGIAIMVSLSAVRGLLWLVEAVEADEPDRYNSDDGDRFFG